MTGAALMKAVGCWKDPAKFMKDYRKITTGFKKQDKIKHEEEP